MQRTVLLGVQSIEFQTVRIKALLRESSAYDPFGNNERAPCVGDTGIVVDVRMRSDGQPEYTVECGRPDGTCTWIAAFVEDELEATEAEASRTKTESACLPLPPVRDYDCGSTADEWGQYTAVGVAVLLFVLTVAAAAGLFFVLFFVWPPGSVVGAGFRAATVMVVFVGIGNLLTGEGVGDLLITATIVGICFFLIGAGWYAWTVA